LRRLVDLLHFSLDAARADLHDAMRGVACFDAVMESIARARALGEFPDILFTATEENIGEMEGVYAICRREGLLLLLNPVFSHGTPQSLSAESLGALESFSRRPMVYLNPSFLALRRAGGNDPRRPTCKAVSRVVVISPRNEILLPCYHFHTERIPIGGDLPGAHASARVAEQRRMEGRHPFCAGCAINCYFEPSFAFPTSRYGIAAVPSKLKYGFSKYVRQPLLRRRAER
jgi:MoaA/NifB/PqqE/SkfB family radical SAM enzyme